MQEADNSANSVDKNTVSRHMAQYRKDTVGTVILSPTRELATQIATEAAKLLSHTDMDVRLFIGGASKGMQLRDFRFRRRDIIVATPGRMNDMLDEPMIQQAVHKAKVLVLDEADTLLDMGFKDAIDTIVRQMPPKGERQTFLFSATVSKEIQRIARSTLRPDHKFIDCVPANETNTHLHIPQYTSIIPSGQDQFLHIARLLAEDAMLHPDGGKAIIFLPTTKMTEITSLIVNAMRPHLPFGSRGTRVFEMHSKKSQHARDTTSSLFRQAKGGYSILVTSDVSARGVDYPGVTRVIQIGVPGSKDTYVHRVGRTGRAGKAGRGDLVLMPFEQAYVHHELQEIPFKPVDVGGLQASLEKMAAEHDANPTPGSSGPAPVLDRRVRPGMRGPPQQPARLQYPILPRLQGLEQRFRDEITPGISELDAKEAFGSQLGFYVGRTSEMGLSRGAVYEALQVWAVEAFGLAEPPTVGSRLMAALGLNKSGGGGMRGRNSGMRRSFNDSQGFRSNAPRMAAFRRGGSSDRRGGGGFRSNDRSDGERHGSYNGRNPYAPRGTTPW